MFLYYVKKKSLLTKLIENAEIQIFSKHNVLKLVVIVLRMKERSSEIEKVLNTARLSSSTFYYRTSKK